MLHHAIDEEGEFVGDGAGSDDVGLDAVASGGRSAPRREEAVVPAVMESSAGEVYTPGLGGEEGEEGGFFVRSYEEREEGDAGDRGGEFFGRERGTGG